MVILALAVLVCAVGALGAHSERHEGQTASRMATTMRTGRLQILRQRQQRVVHLALHLAGALHHAVHPQALPVCAVMMLLPMKAVTRHG